MLDQKSNKKALSSSLSSSSPSTTNNSIDAVTTTTTLSTSSSSSSSSPSSTATFQYQIDDLVQSVSLHVPRTLLLNGSVFPFLILFSIWLYCWVFVYGIDSDDHYEAFLVILVAIAIVQTLVCLCCFWSVHIQTFLNCKKLRLQLPQRNYPKGIIAKVVPTKNNGSSELVGVHETRLTEKSEPIYWFMFQKLKYIWDPNKKQFRGTDFPVNETYEYYTKCKGYQSDEDILVAAKTYGTNLMEMVVPEFFELFIERATAPFFVFQIFSVLLWCLDEYWYYSFFTLFMLILFECTLVLQQLRNMAEIRKMGNKPYLINVYRNSKWRSIESSALVPGDLVSICRSKNDQFVPCDVLILRGSCIVDESMLTGESVPQLKESLENVDDLNVQLEPEEDGKLFVLFGGTKVVQHTPPNKNSMRAPDDGCIGYVLRTGFNTSQGKLLRTILFGVKRVTENNAETFTFILFLLIFAVAAASYVWIKGTEDPERSRYKLLLECTLILTAIIPPDLPIELSLAVNTSLVQLSKLNVFCTEPFRIPLAGKVQICCFDKTGTLTSDDLMIEGVAGISNTGEITLITEIPEQSVQVLATCHSLSQLDDGLVGDPLEKAILLAIDWNLTKQDSVIPKKSKFKAMKIYQRYYFSSALKRMSVLAGYMQQFSNDVFYIGTVKGAPEVVLKMLKNVPENYEKTYLEYSRRGARVLALASKEFGKLESSDVRAIKREDVESDLTFAGFIVTSCPLKSDSKSVIKELVKASHKVVMITGDNALTACHVAKELRFTRKQVVVLTNNNKTTNEWIWQSINEDIKLDLDNGPMELKLLLKEYDLAITGDGLQYLNEYEHEYLLKIIAYVCVFARLAPKQKEFVITTLKNLGYFTLMCGDGTNDVGALKHADVGVSISSHSVVKRKKDRSAGGGDLSAHSGVQSLVTSRMGPRRITQQELTNMTPRERAIAKHRENLENTQELLQKKLSELEDEQVQIVKLGDASIAAPFTSKSSSVQCVCHIIKQGRCTLVTTLQMFKILALNALIQAYCQSVLYVDGVSFSDSQATLQGLFIAACFLFIIRSQPLKVMSKEAPLPNIFNLYTISTILLQFSVHFLSLVYLTQEATALSPPVEGKIVLNIDLKPGEKVEFKPNIINSAVYIICLALQVSTFAVNHKGHPFMESLYENKCLMCAILASSTVVVFLTFGISADINSMFEIIHFPDDFQKTLVYVLLADTILAYVFDRICQFLFGSVTNRTKLLGNKE